jgi:flagellar assembly factor FliW
MLLKTEHLGELEILEENIITFPNGIPAFEHVRQFTIVDSEEPQLPFKWLQCIDNPKLAFVIINPFFVSRNYDFDIKDDLLREININSMDEMVIFSIVVVPEDVNKMTINLKAPVIINVKEKKGMQVILDTDKYSVRHYVLDELKNSQEVDANVSACKEEGAVYSNK